MARYPRAQRRRHRVVLAGLALAFVAGCSGVGTLTTSDVQKVLDDSPLRDQIAKLDCEDTTGEKGNVFECRATFNGKPVTLKGKFTEENRFEIVDLVDEQGRSLAERGSGASGSTSTTSSATS